MKYWAINVGTRKNPKYERLFTYRRKFVGNKVYTNFDCHYVNPGNDASGTGNVAYYVTKYIMKGSDKEQKRQQFLKLNLDPEQFTQVWNVVKCRMTCSKGLGTDVRFYTDEVTETVKNPERTLCQYATSFEHFLAGPDLPPDELPYSNVVKVVTRKKRIMVPNFELCQKLINQIKLHAGTAPYPIFVNKFTGQKSPLSRYYYRLPWVYSPDTAMTIWFSWDPRKDKDPSYMKSNEEKAKSRHKYHQRLKTINNHDTFDEISAFVESCDTPSGAPDYLAGGARLRSFQSIRKDH